jgi:hypothetical protein
MPHAPAGLGRVANGSTAKPAGRENASSGLPMAGKGHISLAWSPPRRAGWGGRKWKR